MDNRHLPWRRVVREKGVICRACAKYRECSYNIFISTDAFNIPVFILLRELLNVEVAEGDGLPDTICRRCVNKLVEFNEFKRIFVNSETELRKRSEFKWLLEEEVRPWEDFAEDETFVEDGSQGESAANLKSEVNEMGVVNPAKEEEMERNAVTAEQMKIETDSAEDLDSGQTLTSNMDPSRVSLRAAGLTLKYYQMCLTKYMKLHQRQRKIDMKVEDGMETDDCSPNSEVRREENEGLEEECGGGGDARIQETEQENQVGCCNNIGKLTLEPEKGSDKFGADKQCISQNEVLIDSSCDFVHEENLLLEHSMANSFVVNCLPEERVKNQKKNVRFYASSEKKFSQLNDRARSIRNQERKQLCHQAENANYPTDYICNYCSATNVKKKSLAVHIKRHVNRMLSKSVVPKKGIPPRFSENLLGKEFKCNECGKKFSTKRDTSSHLLVHSGVKPFKGKECEKMFTQRSSLNTNSVKHTGVKRFKCNECGKMFTQTCNLKKHSLIHTGVKWFKCNECGKMFKKSTNLKRHSLVHTGVKPFKCNECGKMFTQKGNLKMHTIIHTGVKPFKCNDCGKMFTTSSKLKCHSLVHTGVKPFKCNDCGKMFTTSSKLKCHSLVHTGVKPFKCNDCGKMFTTSSKLKCHSLVHTGVMPFKGNDCGKMFTLKSCLNTHSVIHTGVKRFKCNECRKMFSTKRDISRHLLVHSGVKQFKCNECGKMFTQRSSLNTHSVIHTGVKRFKCNECGKMFTQKGNLKTHSLIHTGVKIFKCNECGKMFTKKGDLNTHLVVHTGVKRFKCEECGKMFTTSSNLRRHSVVHTGAR